MANTLKIKDKVVVVATDEELVKLGIADSDVRTNPSTIAGYDQRNNPVLFFMNEYGTEMIYVVLPNHIKPFVK